MPYSGLSVRQAIFRTGPSTHFTNFSAGFGGDIIDRVHSIVTNSAGELVVTGFIDSTAAVPVDGKVIPAKKSYFVRVSSTGVVLDVKYFEKGTAHNKIDRQHRFGRWYLLHHGKACRCKRYGRLALRWTLMALLTRIRFSLRRTRPSTASTAIQPSFSSPNCMQTLLLLGTGFVRLF